MRIGIWRAAACVSALLFAEQSAAQDSTNYLVNGDFSTAPVNGSDWGWDEAKLSVALHTGDFHSAPSCIRLKSNDTGSCRLSQEVLPNLNAAVNKGRSMDLTFWAKSGKPGTSKVRILVQASQNPFSPESPYAKWKDVYYKGYPTSWSSKSIDTTWVECAIRGIPIVDTVNLTQVFVEVTDSASVLLIDDMKLALLPIAAARFTRYSPPGPQAISLQGSRAALRQPAAYTISVFDARGSMVARQSGAGAVVDIATAGLAVGRYILRAATSEGAANGTMTLGK